MPLRNSGGGFFPMTRIFVLVAAVLFIVAGTHAATNSSAQTSDLRMNHVQVLGTHNSYHIEPYPELLQLIKQFEPEQGLTFEYSHRPLAEQLGQLNIRQVELDVFADPGPAPIFASPLGESIVKGPSSVPIAGMTEPGLKVLHIQDIDYRSTCLTFVACLQEIAAWSAANPNHLPVLVLVEAKDDTLELPAGVPPAAVPVPFGAAELQSIDDAIRSVFAPSRLITPDDVRGSRATLEAAVLQDGWPALAQSRGKVLFALDNQDTKRDAYIAGHASLQGRVMFTSSEPGTPEAAFVKLNDPVADQQRIKDLVALGYLVRTRADSDTQEARTGATARRDAALASGAQFVSTDYPVADPDFGTGYSVAIPGGKEGRCNPVLNVAACTATTFDPPPTPTPTVTPTPTATAPATATPTATSTPSVTATPTATATPQTPPPTTPPAVTATPTKAAPRPPSTGDGPNDSGRGTGLQLVLMVTGVTAMLAGGFAALRRTRN